MTVQTIVKRDPSALFEANRDPFVSLEFIARSGIHCRIKKRMDGNRLGFVAEQFPTCLHAPYRFPSLVA